MSWNVLASQPRDIAAAVNRSTPLVNPHMPFGDGNAASAVVRALQAGSDLDA